MKQTNHKRLREEKKEKEVTGQKTFSRGQLTPLLILTLYPTFNFVIIRLFTVIATHRIQNYIISTSNSPQRLKTFPFLAKTLTEMRETSSK